MCAHKSHTRKKQRNHHSRIPSQPHIPPLQESVKPGHDFQKYVNGAWLRHVSMPPYLSSYGVSEEIEEQINQELQQIITNARKTIESEPDKNIPHTTYLLGTLAESALNTQTQDENVKILRKLVSSLHCIRDFTDIGATLGDFMKHRTKTILDVVVVPAEKESDIYRLALAPGDLGLPDPTYQEDTGSRTVVAQTKLLKHLGQEFDVEGLERVVAIEQSLAQAILNARGDQEVILTGIELKTMYSAFPWDSFVASAFEMSPSEFRNHKFLIFSKRWLKTLNHMCRELPLEQWKLLFSAHLILDYLALLPPPYDNLEFEFFGRRLRGQTEKTPQSHLALRLAEQWLTGSLGAAFVKQFVSPKMKSDALSIAREIRSVAAERAGATEWLEPKTRQAAKKKVQNIYLGVAYPSHITKDKTTALNPERLLENVLALSSLDFADEMKKVNQKLDPAEWDDAVFAVNAQQQNEGNRLILPAGILRWPFFHTEATDGWNFGALGATIGHEICHAFDNDGKEYDETGNRNPWWTRAESRRQHEKTEALIQLQNKTEQFGHHLNGVLTLSENIADLGGVAIALSALKKRLAARGASKQEMKEEICNFFVSFAVSWRTKDRKEKALQSLFMDVHAPPEARVNNIVSQFDDWQECFDVKPGDRLQKDPTHRIRIF